MSIYGAFEPDVELKVSTELIKNIINGIEFLVFKSNSIIYLTKNLEDDINNNQNLEYKKWTEI